MKFFHQLSKYIENLKLFSIFISSLDLKVLQSCLDYLSVTIPQWTYDTYHDDNYVYELLIHKHN